MAVLTLVCISLGIWQVARLAEKQQLVASVEERITLNHVRLPRSNEWHTLDMDVFNFRPVKLEGEFAPGNTVLVFTSLADAKGTQKGAGYWVMSPFVLKTGGTVIVNRGFIPQGAAALFDESMGGAPPPDGEMEVRGIARRSEAANAFTPGPDSARNIEYVRDAQRLGTMMDPGLRPFIDLYVDQEVTEPNTLPQAGETVVHFSNNHFQYMLTWFALAAVTVLMTAFWLYRQLRK